ncbi:MAG: SCO family protein [Nocardioidaceae bacterium]
MARGNRVPGRVAAVAAVLVACLSGCTASRTTPEADNPGGAVISNRNEDTTFHGAEPAQPYRMPNVTLTADNGQPFNLVTDTAYPVTLVFFGYTNCPDVCPLVLGDLSATYLQLPAPVRERTQVLFITTDPARDTDEVLRGYLARYNPAFLGLTGSLVSIKTVAEVLGVPVSGMKRLPGGGYDVGHGAQVIGFRDNRAPVVWTEGTAVPDMVSDVIRLAG